MDMIRQGGGSIILQITFTLLGCRHYLTPTLQSSVNTTICFGLPLKHEHFDVLKDHIPYEVWMQREKD